VKGSHFKMNTHKEADFPCLAPLSDESLCEQVRQGNRDAEEVLASRYHRLVRAISRPYFLAGGDSEDLLQEGMLGLIKAMREYDAQQGASFATFAEVCIRRRLYTVLKSSASGKHQALNQALPLNPTFVDLASAQHDPEFLLIDRETTTDMLNRIRKQLSSFESKILEHFLDGLTCREISQAVGKSPKSVENAVQRIRRKVGQELQVHR